MKRLSLIIAFFLSSFYMNAQSIPSYSADALMQRLQNPDTFYIVNFWATWCGPCVKELPEFNKLQEQFKDRPVKVLMVSLDFKEAYPSRILSFIKKKKLSPEVVWFNETNANLFIPKIDNQWQGSIPATLLFYRKNEYRNFFEGTVTAGQIFMLVEKQLAL